MTPSQVFYTPLGLIDTLITWPAD